MKSRLLKAGLVYLVISVLMLISVPAFAASNAYSVKNYAVHVKLQPDGSALVTETIEYHMHENLRDFQYKINYASSGSINLEKVGVADQPASIDQAIFVEAEPSSDISGTVRPLTYHLQDDGNTLQINLHVFSESDSIRTVSISYKLHRFVIRQLDTAVIRHDYFNSGVAGDIENARVTLILPQSVALAETWNLPVSLAEFSISQPEENQIRAATNFINAADSVEITSLLPLELFPEAALAAEPLSREILIAETRDRDELLLRRQETRQSILTLIYVLLVISILISLIVYGRFDRERKSDRKEWQGMEELCSVPPALLAVLMKKKRPGNLILSTLFDLVRRRELERDGLVFFRKNKDNDFIGFNAYEIFLLQWLFGRLANDDAVSISEIRRYARDSATTDEFHIYYKQFCTLIQEEYDQSGFIDSEKTKRGRIINSIISLIYLILGLVFTIVWQITAGLLLLIPAVWFFIYSLKLRRQSKKGREYYDSIKSVSHVIHRTIKPRTDIPADFLLNCLPQAVALHEAVPLLQGLISRYPDGPHDVPAADMSIYGINTKTSSWKASVSALAEDIKVMDSLLSASILLASGIHS